MSRRTLSYPLLSALSCATSPQVGRMPATGAARWPSGRYSIALCRGSCGTDTPDRAYARGTLLLFPSDVPQGAGLGPAGCFALQGIRPQPDSYALEDGKGPVVIRPGPDACLKFLLYSSADASYVVTLHRGPHGFIGSGQSVGGAGDCRFSGCIWRSPVDEVVAIRLGNADPAECRSLLGDVHSRAAPRDDDEP